MSRLLKRETINDISKKGNGKEKKTNWKYKQKQHRRRNNILTLNYP